MRASQKIVGVGAAIWCLLAPSLAGAEVVGLNIVLMFVDDMGYGDVGSYGAESYETPHIDRLAEQGIRLTDFYVSSAVCSASRAALLTGCYHERVGISGALGPGSKVGLDPEETTLAELLSDQGYRTGIFGKWHLGDKRPFLPLQQGFDRFYGIPYSNDMWPFHPTNKSFPDLPLYEQNEVVNPAVGAKDQQDLTVEITERAKAFISAAHAEGEPFFCYIPHPQPHVPLFVSERFRGKTGAGLYGDVIAEIDWSMGQIMGLLDELGLAERTLVIFSSDNGPWLSYGDHGGSAGPLREGKGSSWDGGIRVPFVARYPGKIPAGTVCAEPCMTIDLLPTIASLVGAEMPARKIDGRDIWPLLSGEEAAESPHEALYFYYANGQLQGLRSGRWKMLYPHRYRSMEGQLPGGGGMPGEYAQIELDGVRLFDLREDIGEREDLSGERPEVVGRLEAMAEGIRAELGDSLRGIKGSEVRGPGRVK